MSFIPNPYNRPRIPMRAHLPLVVLSHLRWNFVYQRPQHLLSRLAANRRVLFVEEPLHCPGESFSWECTAPAPNMTVCRPRTSIPTPGFNDDVLALLDGRISELVNFQGLCDY